MNKKEIEAEIYSWQKDRVDDTNKRTTDLLDLLREIPDGTKLSFICAEITAHTEDKSFFTKIAKKLGVQVKKTVDQYNRTGRLEIKKGSAVLDSTSIPLPETCEFRKIQKTYEVLEPIGNCGSWFDKGEQAIPEQ